MQKTNVESRKKWAAPELKKVDIEQITATGHSTHYDGGATGDNHS